VDEAPRAAHRLAVAFAAGQAALRIKSKYTGTLARDVSNPADIGPLISEVGSGAGGRAPLPYAAMEQFGGTIHGNPLLYIRDRRGGGWVTVRSTGQVQRSLSGNLASAQFVGRARSAFGGPITAVVPSVQHVGKHYLEGATESYPLRFTEVLGGMLPG